MHTHSLAQYMKPIYRGDWAAVGELMLSSANKLAEVGADCLICPTTPFTRPSPTSGPAPRCPGCASRRSSPGRPSSAGSGASA